MIKSITPCGECMHKSVCQYKDNALNASNKLKTEMFSTNSYDDYDWETMSTAKHFDVTFSCRDFHKEGGTIR